MLILKQKKKEKKTSSWEKEPRFQWFMLLRNTLNDFVFLFKILVIGRSLFL